MWEEMLGYEKVCLGVGGGEKRCGESMGGVGGGVENVHRGAVVRGEVRYGKKCGGKCGD